MGNESRAMNEQDGACALRLFRALEKCLVPGSDPLLAKRTLAKREFAQLRDVVWPPSWLGQAVSSPASSGMRGLVWRSFLAQNRELPDELLSFLSPESAANIFGSDTEGALHVLSESSNNKEFLRWQAKHWGASLGNPWIWLAARTLDDFSIARGIPDDEASLLFSNHTRTWQTDGQGSPMEMQTIVRIPVCVSELVEMERRFGTDCLSISPLDVPWSGRTYAGGFFSQTVPVSAAGWLFGSGNRASSNMTSAFPHACAVDTHFKMASHWIEGVIRRAQGSGSDGLSKKRSQFEVGLAGTLAISAGLGVETLERLSSCGWDHSTNTVPASFLRPRGFSAEPAAGNFDNKTNHWMFDLLKPASCSVLASNREALEWLFSKGAEPPCAKEADLIVKTAAFIVSKPRGQTGTKADELFFDLSKRDPASLASFLESTRQALLISACNPCQKQRPNKPPTI